MRTSRIHSMATTCFIVTKNNRVVDSLVVRNRDQGLMVRRCGRKLRIVWTSHLRKCPRGTKTIFDRLRINEHHALVTPTRQIDWFLRSHGTVYKLGSMLLIACK